jgi:hypothetical protein
MGIAETIFSSIKRTFGEHVTARKFHNMVKEILLKAALYNMLRKTCYKWKDRYEYGINGLHDVSKVPRTIKYKVDTTTEETIRDLRLKRLVYSKI